MPEKHENTHRWGGPGASHEDRTKPEPETKGKEARTDTEVRFSHVSGGGGERDRHHAHDVHGKRDFEENSEQRRKP